MEGWEQRRTSFGAVAADYAALRPPYPADVVGFLLGDAPRRVLRPGGVVGFVWNTRDDRVPWVGALGELLAAEARDHEADQTVVNRFAAELSAEVAVFDSAVTQRATPEQVVRGIGTRSYVAMMDDARRADFLGGVRRLLADHPDTRGRDVLELPYRTRAYRLTPR